MRRGCCGRRPWRGWWATRGIQPPRAGRCHVKASQAFTPSLSKEGSLLSASLTYVALYNKSPGVIPSLLEREDTFPAEIKVDFNSFTPSLQAKRCQASALQISSAIEWIAGPHPPWDGCSPVDGPDFGDGLLAHCGPCEPPAVKVIPVIGRGLCSPPPPVPSFSPSPLSRRRG